jgi:hypothetical protein
VAAFVAVVAGLAAASAEAQDARPAELRTAKPRVIGEVEMRQLAIFDPALNPFRARPLGAKSPTPPNQSPEYAEKGLGSLVPAPPATVTDGPLAAEGTQAVYAYQPRLATNFSVRDTGSWFPADCVIAAGPSHVVVAFNSAVAIYDKQGTRTFISSLDGLLGATAGWKGHFDPKVVYDEGSGRFYLMALDLNLSARQSVWSVAVSITSDPMQGWYVYGQMANQWDGEGVDYEDLGFGPRAIYLTGNYISFSDWNALPPPAANHNTALWVMNKADMLAGQAVTFWTFGDLTAESGQQVFLTRVAQAHVAPPGGLDGFVSAWQSMANPPNTARISVWGVTLPANFPTGGPALDRRTVDVTQPAGFPNGRQSGGPARLQGDNFGAGQLSLYYRNNALTIPLPVGSGSVSAARVVQISVLSWPTISLGWQNDLTDATNDHLWPNVAVNQRGQVGLGYYRSGPSEFANFRYSMRTVDDPGFVASQLVRAGDAYVGNPLTDTGATLHRWGDYSGVAVDPVTQGFWFFGMYGANRGSEDNTDFRLWCGYVPRAVYVDWAHGGVEVGTTQRPWNTFGEAMFDAITGNDVVMKAGLYNAVGVHTKPVTVIADGGVVELR